METTDNHLDAEELFHLGLKASQSGDHEKAIACLKRSAGLKPDSNAHYVLAAEYAEIGMYPKALDEIQAALRLNPQLWTAHLQKGLMHLMVNDPGAADKAWEALAELSPSHHLHQFGKGLQSMLRQELSASQEALELGIRTNRENPALNRDMQKILENLKKTSTDQTEAGQAEKNHLYLSAYQSDEK